LLRRDTEQSLSGYFTDLEDFPLYNWIQCNNGDLKYTRKGSKGNDINDAEAWLKLYDDYIKRYDLGKLHKKMLKIMREKALLELNFVETRERFELTKIELKEAELIRMMKNNGDGMTLEQSLVHLSKWIGYRLHPKEITVVEYFNIQEQYGKANQTTGHI